jgi:hypothetical protein
MPCASLTHDKEIGHATCIEPFLPTSSGLFVPFGCNHASARHFPLSCGFSKGQVEAPVR